MRKLLAIAAAAVLLIAIAVPIAFAATQGSPCGPSDGNNVRVWENSIGDTSSANDSLWLCGNSYSAFQNIQHTVPGNCADDFLGRSDWNDCVSSVTPKVVSGQRLCLYFNDNYGGSVLAQFVGPMSGSTRYNVNSDDLTSLRFTSGSC